MKYFVLTVLSFLIISCDYKVEKTIDFNSSSDAEVEFYSSEETMNSGSGQCDGSRYYIIRNF